MQMVGMRNCCSLRSHCIIC